MTFKVLIRETIASTVMLETLYEAVWFNSPEDCELNFPFCENLRNIIWYCDYCFKSELFIYLKEFQTFTEIVFSHMLVSRCVYIFRTLYMWNIYLELELHRWSRGKSMGSLLLIPLNNFLWKIVCLILYSYFSVIIAALSSCVQYLVCYQ
jgi:hypothetical protein